jgi:hypothetical protein
LLLQSLNQRIALGAGKRGRLRVVGYDKAQVVPFALSHLLFLGLRKLLGMQWR